MQEVYFSQEAVSALGKHPQQDIYQQEVVKYEDHNQQQYYIQDPQQLYHQQAVATIQHIQQDPHQMYHPALQGVGDQHELVYKFMKLISTRRNMMTTRRTTHRDLA